MWPWTKSNEKLDQDQKISDEKGDQPSYDPPLPPAPAEETYRRVTFTFSENNHTYFEVIGEPSKDAKEIFNNAYVWYKNTAGDQPPVLEMEHKNGTTLIARDSLRTVAFSAGTRKPLK